MEYAVNIENLTRQYFSKKGLSSKVTETVTAVDNVSFHINKGQAIGLLGPNGAGKTTLIKMLTTVLLPTDGRATILGKDIVKDADYIRHKINVVYGGDKGLYTRLTARDNLKYFCNLYHVPMRQQEAKMKNLLELVGLSDVADRRVENFSRGMRQRLHIARGLINDPEILFLDEPTIGLDPVSGIAVRQLMKKLNERGMTILLTTHYMQEVEELCERVVIINKGRMVLWDDIENVKSKYRKNYEIQIRISKHMDADKKFLNAIANKYSNCEVSDKGNEFTTVKFTANDINTAVGDIHSVLHENDIIDLNVKTNSLQDVYVDIIQSS